MARFGKCAYEIDFAIQTRSPGVIDTARQRRPLAPPIRRRIVFLVETLIDPVRRGAAQHIDLVASSGDRNLAELNRERCLGRPAPLGIAPACVKSKSVTAKSTTELNQEGWGFMILSECLGAFDARIPFVESKGFFSFDNTPGAVLYERGNHNGRLSGPSQRL